LDAILIICWHFQVSLCIILNASKACKFLWLSCIIPFNIFRYAI
jgi:hypothetical protein